jgi:hypothetical protein
MMGATASSSGVCVQVPAGAYRKGLGEGQQLLPEFGVLRDARHRHDAEALEAKALQQQIRTAISVPLLLLLVDLLPAAVLWASAGGVSSIGTAYLDDLLREVRIGVEKF